MCRLFGFVGESDLNVVKIIRGLILAEESKNPHGTGFVINHKGLFTIKKKGIRGLHFIAQGHADFLWNNKFDYLMGHVRYKTAGEASDRNAHPFGSQVAGKWYFLAHNGVLGNEMNEIAKKFKANVDKVKVDSEMFLRCITAQMREGKDIVDAIKDVTYEVSDVGDFAFTLLTPELYIWRNKERPLNVIYYKNSIFYASTLDMFKKALEISGVKMEKIKYSEVKPYVLYKITKEKGKVHIHVVEEEMPHKERKPKVKPYYSTGNLYSSYSSYNWNYNENSKNKKKKKITLDDDKWGKTYEEYGLFGSEPSSSYKKWLYRPISTMTMKELKSALSDLEWVYYDSTMIIPEEDRIEIEAKIIEIEDEIYMREKVYEDIEKEEVDEYEPF